MPLLYIIVGHSFVRKFLVSHAQKTRVEPWLLDERRLEGFDEEQKRLLREVAHECEQEIAFMNDIASHYPAWATLNPIGSGAASLGPFLRLKEACTPEMIPILEHFLQHLPESVTYRVIWDAEHDYEDVYESPVPRWLSDIIAACREKEDRGCQNPTT